ncbi:MAG: FAD:protein FMN transferase [Rhodospirillaceae bacterium]|nr:FAD:protein FMN transferase [Rhodospirillaceae bacterium]
MTHDLTRRSLVKGVGSLALATPFLSLMACDSGDRGRGLSQLSGRTMGTTYQIKITDKPAGVDVNRLTADLADILEAINDQMSTYRPGSELSHFNAGPARSEVRVSSDTATVAEAALRVAALTGGAFDPTVGPVVDLWGFGSGADGQQVPSKSLIEDASAKIGFNKVGALSAPPRLIKRNEAVQLDLSGIAKGFAVDKIAEHLEQIGIGHYLVEIGGELRGRGWSPRGGGWRVGIEHPSGVPSVAQRVVHLDRHGLATSGDYRLFFEEEGRYYSHIIDPRTARPVEHGLASVTVIATTTMLADGLSTALMVMGLEAGMELAEREGIAAFFIARNGRSFVETSSTAFMPYFLA